MTQDDGYSWATCPICHKRYVTDGGDPTCNDKVCQTVYERLDDQAEALREVEALLDEEYLMDHPAF